MWSRLQILAAEDVGMGDPMAPAVVRALREGVLDADEGSYDRLVFAAQAAGYLARALKDPVNVEIMQTQLLDEQAPDVPPEAICVHTRRGQEAGETMYTWFLGTLAHRAGGPGPGPHVAGPAGRAVPGRRPPVGLNGAPPRRGRGPFYAQWRAPGRARVEGGHPWRRRSTRSLTGSTACRRSCPMWA